MTINSIPYTHLLAVLRAEEAGKDIVHQADGAHIYAMDSVGKLHELGWVDPWLSPSDFQSAVDHVKFRGQDRPPISLADLIDAENPLQMYYVPDSKRFERRIRRHIRANHQTPDPTAPTTET